MNNVQAIAPPTSNVQRYLIDDNGMGSVAFWVNIFGPSPDVLDFFAETNSCLSGPCVSAFIRGEQPPSPTSRAHSQDQPAHLHIFVADAGLTMWHQRIREGTARWRFRSRRRWPRPHPLQLDLDSVAEGIAFERWDYHLQNGPDSYFHIIFFSTLRVRTSQACISFTHPPSTSSFTNSLVMWIISPCASESDSQVVCAPSSHDAVAAEDCSSQLRVAYYTFPDQFHILKWSTTREPPAIVRFVENRVVDCFSLA